MMTKREIKKLNDHIKMIATHCYFRGEYYSMSMFINHDGKIDDTGLALLAADYLTLKKNVPFRIAHHIVGCLTTYMQEHDKMFYQLTLKQYNKFSHIYRNNKNLFDEDIQDIMRIPVSVKVCAKELSLESLFKYN